MATSGTGSLVLDLVYVACTVALFIGFGAFGRVLARL